MFKEYYLYNEKYNFAIFRSFANLTNFPIYFQFFSNYFITAFPWLRETTLFPFASHDDERFPVAG